MRVVRRMAALAVAGAWTIAVLLGAGAEAQEVPEEPSPCDAPVTVTVPVPDSPLECETTTTTSSTSTTTTSSTSTTTTTSTTVPDDEDEDDDDAEDEYEESPVVDFGPLDANPLPEINLGGDPTASDPGDVVEEEVVDDGEALQPIVSAEDGFRYSAVFMLPLVILAVAGSLGWGLTQPVTVRPR